MNLKEDIKPLSYIKANATSILKRVNETRSPVIITQNGEAKAVLIDAESYQLLIDTIGMLKIISQGESEKAF